MLSLLFFPYILQVDEAEDMDSKKTAVGRAVILATFSPVVLQTSQTWAGDEVRPDFLHHVGILCTSQLHFCSASLFRETGRRDNSKQTQMVTFLSFFRSTDTPFSHSSVPRIAFYLLCLLQFQEHLGLRSDQSFRAATFPKPPSAQLQQSPGCVMTEWGEKLWEFAPAQAKGGRTGTGLT